MSDKTDAIESATETAMDECNYAYAYYAESKDEMDDVDVPESLDFDLSNYELTDLDDVERAIEECSAAKDSTEEIQSMFEEAARRMERAVMSLDDASSALEDLREALQMDDCFEVGDMVTWNNQVTNASIFEVISTHETRHGSHYAWIKSPFEDLYSVSFKELKSKS